MNYREIENQIKETIENNIKEGKIKEIWYNPHYNCEEFKRYFVENIRTFLLHGTHSNSETTRILRNINPERLQKNN